MMRLGVLVVCLAFCSAPLAAQAVRVGQAKQARPELTLGTLTLAVSPATVNFTLLPTSQSYGSSSISITTAGTGLGLLSSVKLFAYFSSTSPLTDASGDTLPSSAIFGLDSSGSATSYTAFTQTTPFSGGSGLLLFSTLNLLSLQTGRTDALSLMIDLTNLPQQPAGTYSGTLLLQAQAL